MCKGRVTYPPVTTVTDASERPKGKVTYPTVTPATGKGPANSSWHLKGWQERHFGDVSIPIHLPSSSTDRSGTAQARGLHTGDQRGLSTNPGLTRTGAHVRAPGVSGK